MNPNLDVILKTIKNKAALSSEDMAGITGAVEKIDNELKQKQKDLEQSLKDLQLVRKQLLQQEKLASLGQLTAGIAHEIKNPLNFINNFSELSIELIQEIKDELEKLGESKILKDGNLILQNIEANLAKIKQHGTRADDIVKSMLKHSRGTGQRQPTDLNALIKEYMNMSYHGMRAGPNRISVEINLELDNKLGEVVVNPEEMSRVFINLFNNAFDAMGKKQEAVGGKGETGSYEPKLTVRSYQNGGNAIVEVEDNGPGIPEEIKDKILQPFFTTKKGTEGTGLGLSITNDIVKAHDGTINIKSRNGNSTIFLITIPIKQNANEISGR